MHTEPEDIVRRYYDLFNARLLDETERLIAPDALFHYPEMAHQLVGKAGHRALSDMWLTAFPDLRLNMLSARANGNHSLVTHSMACGTHRGLLQLGEMSVSATGRRMRVEFQHVMQVIEGRIRDVVLQLDVEELVRQLTGPVPSV
jgi:predicted ester cyclase